MVTGSAPNKGMHPTANSVAFTRETWVPVQLCTRRLNASVRIARRRCKNNRLNGFELEAETLTGLNP
jgi:hypothetical protein